MATSTVAFTNADMAGIKNKIRFHDMRHTFASQFMMSGGSLFDLQKILGHTDVKMTLRYAHFSSDHLQKSVQFMDFGVGHSEQIEKNAPIMPLRDDFGEILHLKRKAN
ncbi:MAG TPA: tyrosine-type recombinase/integrase [Bacteriovoracaceae bacterium]|nr:tyrosine-type recombinase/integrase [Bacteriovoracaceae bacterium]